MTVFSAVHCTRVSGAWLSDRCDRLTGDRETDRQTVLMKLFLMTD